MKEHPISFSGPMVQAILSGRKTQTRRICKPQPYSVGDQFSTRQHGTLMIKNAGEENWSEKPCPYGKIGDRLWVRESFTPVSEFDPELGIMYRADYHAGLEKKDGDAKWKPSIHMPRWASRINLEITGIRVDRLVTISAADAIAEGIESEVADQTMAFRNYSSPDNFYVHWGDGLDWQDAAKESYQSIWNSIHGPDSWSQNPFVWVIEFKRVEQ